MAAKVRPFFYRGLVKAVACKSANGEIAKRMDWNEYGNVLLNSDTLSIPFGYAGGLYDTDTKLIRFGARDYDAVTGRWTTKVLSQMF